MTWEIHPRNADLSRTLDPLSRWSSLTLVERHNVPDTWVLRGPADVLSVFEPGMGCILDREDEQVTSGQMRSYRRWVETQDGRSRELMELGFASDLASLGGRVIFPDEDKVLTTTPSTFTSAYDTRSGAVETVLLGYVSAHLGSLALADRRLAGLTLPTPQGRGGTTTVNARFDNLGVLVQSLAEAGNLRVTVGHSEDGGTPHLALAVEAVPDVSVNVRFGPQGSTAMGMVTAWSVEMTAPEVTRALALGGGDLAARVVSQHKDTDAESLWGAVSERTVDQRQTTDAAEMTRAAEEALASGAGAVSVAFTVADGPDVQYRRDYGIGYRVGVDLPGLPDAASDNVIREVTTTVSNESGQPTERVQVVVGTPDATTTQTRSGRQVATALRRVTALERST